MSKILIRFSVIFLLALSCLCIVGCEESAPTDTCDHIWKSASCAFPETCYLCKETRGNLGDHQFTLATCTKESKCHYCDAIGGEALGHDFSQPTCLNLSTCWRCGESQGERLGHEYAPATCTKPATCIRCPAVGEEKPLGHTFKMTTCTVCHETVTVTNKEELLKFMNDGIPSITTPFGKINVSFTFEGENLLTVRIGSQNLYVVEKKKPLGNLISLKGENYEVSKQAILAVLDFEMELAALIESVLPDQKTQIGFFEDGYEYPGLGLGYQSHLYFALSNYGGQSIVGLEEDENGICDWYLLETDPFVYCSQALNMTPCQIHPDIRNERPEYHLYFYHHIEGIILP